MRDETGNPRLIFFYIDVKKVVLAFDKFKGVATSLQLGCAAAEALKECAPHIETVVVPCADGGDGTVEAIGQGMPRMTCVVTGPTGNPVTATYALDGHVAVMELASASGLALLGGACDVEQTSTYGTGEMMAHAMAHGAKHLVIGIGGSATNDCGMGLLAALGVVFRDEAGQIVVPCGENLAKVASVDSSHAMTQGVSVEVITDVDNPLLGPHGAAHTFAPQKGASAEQVRRLEQGAAHFAQFLPQGVADVPGAGAAGGVGAALKGFFADATLCPGAEAILNRVDFDTKLMGADLVITGEGQIDSTTSHGKLPFAVMRRCQRKGAPVVALGGAVKAVPQGFDVVKCINPEGCDLNEALKPEVCIFRLKTTVKQIIKDIQV